MQVKITGFLFLILWMLACNFKETKKNIAENEKKIAEIAEHFITDRDIQKLLPENYTPEDSIALVRNYIEQWAKNILLLEEAQHKINATELKDIENKVIEYRNQLLVNQYSQQIIEKNKENNISDQEVLVYYEKHKESFELNQNIVQYQFITVPQEQADLAEETFKFLMDEKRNELKKQIKQWGDLPFQLDDSKWIGSNMLFSDLPSEIPIAYFDKLLQNSYLRYDGNRYTYLVKILNKKLKGQPAPLEYVKPTIKKLLIDESNLHLLDETKNKLYKKALNDEKIILHEP